MHILNEGNGNHSNQSRFREENKVANVLAKERVRHPFLEETSILEVPPMYAIKALEANTLGTIFVRKIDVCNIDNAGQPLAFNYVPGPSRNDRPLPRLI